MESIIAKEKKDAKGKTRAVYIHICEMRKPIILSQKLISHVVLFNKYIINKNGAVRNHNITETST